MEHRDYQQAMIGAIQQRWARGLRRVLGVLPTGGGKTEVAVSIIADQANIRERALIVVDRKVLAVQWVERLRRHGLDFVGVLQGDNTRATYAPILVATAQTIRSRGVPKGVSYIVIDESHIWHESHDTVLESLGDAQVLGLTATPLRAGLGLRFDTVVVGASIRKLIAAGYLVPARYYGPRRDALEAALCGVSIRAGDFAINELSEVMRGKAIMGDTVGTWQRRGEDRQTIAFCVDKQHARDLAGEFNTAGIDAEVVVDETSDEDRADIFRRFDTRDVRVLCSVGVLAVGFDSPIASCAILARPTMSLSLHIQQGGRILRPLPGKTDALILDHAGNTIRHGLLEDFDPPTDLSTVDKDTDRRNRHDQSGVWVCRNCDSINPKTEDICCECGAGRRPMSGVFVLDGELVRVGYEAGDPKPGPTREDVRIAYLQHLYYAESKGLKPGWAFYATLRRFKIPESKGRHVIEWGWRDLEPIPPDAETSRWLRADFQRTLIVSRWRKEREAVGA